jgi:hypothetical protein
MVGKVIPIRTRNLDKSSLILQRHPRKRLFPDVCHWRTFVQLHLNHSKHHLYRHLASHASHLLPLVRLKTRILHFLLFPSLRCNVEDPKRIFLMLKREERQRLLMSNRQAKCTRRKACLHPASFLSGQAPRRAVLLAAALSYHLLHRGRYRGERHTHNFLNLHQERGLGRSQAPALIADRSLGL